MLVLTYILLKDIVIHGIYYYRYPDVYINVGNSTVTLNTLLVRTLIFIITARGVKKLCPAIGKHQNTHKNKTVRYLRILEL